MPKLSLPIPPVTNSVLKPDPCPAQIRILRLRDVRIWVSFLPDSPRDTRTAAWLAPVMAFEIHPRLAASGFEIGQLGGCRLLLKNNALFPWFLLIPEVEGVEELHQLGSGQYLEVMLAQRQVSEFVASYFQPEKLNTGCIGNQVRQLHLHIIGRSSSDPAWPGTVWAYAEKTPYLLAEVEEITAAARHHLRLD